MPDLPKGSGILFMSLGSSGEDDIGPHAATEELSTTPKKEFNRTNFPEQPDRFGLRAVQVRSDP